MLGNVYIVYILQFFLHSFINKEYLKSDLFICKNHPSSDIYINISFMKINNTILLYNNTQSTHLYNVVIFNRDIFLSHGSFSTFSTR